MNRMARGMEAAEIPTEIQLSHPPRCLGTVYLDWVPQPGAQVDVEGQRYTVLERRHRYQLQTNRYQLQQMILYVQPATHDAVDITGDGSIGDVNCQYNARSALLRCAINPEGPCQSCNFFLLRNTESPECPLVAE